jgi:hypothetical protein
MEQTDELPKPIIFYPYFIIIQGARRGVRKFQYVTAEEYRKLGLLKSKATEYDRIKTRKIATNPELRRKYSDRRAWRRHNEPGMREHEAKQERNRKSQRSLAR